MSKSTHGGQREGAGPPRKMVNPTRVTITLEASQLEALKARHGNKWQDFIRELIESNLKFSKIKN